ncbi:hypothetical protein GFS60_04714 [Rhodococcus sp. WAY2]|nr:hypothetical protein GFS60_04714 [Rhodococcus sp. WAY2]
METGSTTLSTRPKSIDRSLARLELVMSKWRVTEGIPDF